MEKQVMALCLPFNFSLQAVEGLDASLVLAHGRWWPAVEKALQGVEMSHMDEALTPASEAIRRSADVHPQYHFLESGLHTALGSLHLHHGERDEAKRHFDRAVFLHHDNAVALVGLEMLAHCAETPSPLRGEGWGEGDFTARSYACDVHPQPALRADLPSRGGDFTLPPYTHAKAWTEWLEFCGVEDNGEKSGIFDAWQQAERSGKDEAISFYSRAITLCDATHQQYHALAAQPWWLRAALHRALGEHLLAMNDLKRGLDLDRQNAWARQQLAELKEVP
jgi:tetratricopeptide (TPR) repeat protein